MRRGRKLTMPKDFDPTMDANEAAEMYGADVRTIYRWRKIYESGNYVPMSYEERGALEMETCRWRNNWIKARW